MYTRRTSVQYRVLSQYTAEAVERTLRSPSRAFQYAACVPASADIVVTSYTVLRECCSLVSGASACAFKYQKKLRRIGAMFDDDVQYIELSTVVSVETI